MQIYNIRMNSPPKDQLLGLGSPRQSMLSPQKNKALEMEKNQLRTNPNNNQASSSMTSKKSRPNASPCSMTLVRSSAKSKPMTNCKKQQA